VEKKYFYVAISISVITNLIHRLFWIKLYTIWQSLWIMAFIRIKQAIFCVENKKRTLFEDYVNIVAVWACLNCWQYLENCVIMLNTGKLIYITEMEARIGISCYYNCRREARRKRCLYRWRWASYYGAIVCYEAFC
jgi:predicted metal-binding protein